MVDTSDCRGISCCSIDFLSHFHVSATSLASYSLGAGNELGHFWANMVLDSGAIQILYLAFSFAGDLDDAVGTQVAKATDLCINHP